MNALVSISYEDRLKAEHRARQALPAPVAVVVNRKTYDAHIVAYRDWMANAPLTCKDFLRRRCEDIGISHRAILAGKGPYSTREIRDMLMVEVKAFCPRISNPQLGKLFGGRNAATVFIARHRVAARMGEEKSKQVVRRKYDQMLKAYELSKVRSKARGE